MRSARPGNPVTIKGHTVPFSLYVPSGHVAAGESRLIASNPWRCIELYVLRRGKARTESLAYLRQASDFLSASQNATSSARPLLLYYSFLNLVKVLIRCKDSRAQLRSAIHGISEDGGNSASRRFTVKSQRVKLQAKVSKRLSIFHKLAELIGWNVTDGARYSVYELLSQVPSIHRSFMHITGSEQMVYYAPSVQFCHDPDERVCWAAIDVYGLPGSVKQLPPKTLERRRFFRRIFEPVKSRKADVRSFESRVVGYENSPAEALREVAQHCQAAGMVSILTDQGYRYYVGNFEPRIRLHQILVSYLATFYFGSAARYRPADLEKAIGRRFGWAIEEFLSTQSRQFIYLIANEIVEREVVRPWSLSEERFRL